MYSLYSGEGCVIISPPGVVNKLGLYILDIEIPVLNLVLEYSGTAVYTTVFVLEYTAVHDTFPSIFVDSCCQESAK
jgi:hypothetical protein